MGSEKIIGISMKAYAGGYWRFGDEKYQKMKAHGFGAVDISMSDTNSPLYTAPSQEMLQKEKRLADQAGILIHQVHGPWRYPPQDASEAERNERMDKMKRSLEMTAMLGCKNWVIHPLNPFGTQDKDTDDAPKTWDINLEFFTKLLPFARKHDITVCLENMPWESFSMASPAEILRFVREINDDHFKICFDTGHSRLVKDLSTFDTICLLGENIQVLHLHDNKQQRDLHLPPYFGSLNWEKCAVALDAIGFQGVYSLEVSPPAALSDELFERFACLYADCTKEIFCK